MSKALQPPSAKWIRVIATLIPDLEISWVRAQPEGREKLYVNMNYVLLDEDGEMHLPKDSKRREISVTAQEETAFRAAVVEDLMNMSTKGMPLSPAYYRQQLCGVGSLSMCTHLSPPTT